MVTKDAFPMWLPGGRSAPEMVERSRAVVIVDDLALLGDEGEGLISRGVMLGQEIGKVCWRSRA